MLHAHLVNAQSIYRSSDYTHLVFFLGICLFLNRTSYLLDAHFQIV